MRTNATSIRPHSTVAMSVCATICWTATTWAAQQGDPATAASRPRIAAHLAQAPSATSPYAARDANPAVSFAARGDAPGRLAVALDGYCPVALLLEQRWQPGDRRYPLEFDHREYWFAGDRERKIFAAAPSTYAPVLSGDCIVTFADGGGRTPGRLENGFIHDGRLFFFASEIEMQRFHDAPDAYADADLARDGICPVASLERGKPVPGMPAAAARFFGQRYFFASAHHRAKFFQQPERYVNLAELSLRENQLAALSRRSPTKPGVSDAASRPTPTQRRALGSRRDLASQTPGRENSESDQIAFSGAPLMSGYCPVSCRDQSNWVRGKYDYRTEHEGYTVLLAGKAEFQAFLAAPQQYMPVLGGDCVVTYVQENQRRRGSVFHAAFFPMDPERGLVDESRLYLFASEANKNAFAEEPEKFVDADIAARGVCVVTRRRDRKIVQGDRDVVARYAGLRYFFAGEAERNEFLEDPERYAER